MKRYERCSVACRPDSAAEGSAVRSRPTSGSVTRRRRRGSLKPLCNEKPRSRRGRNDISTSYLDPSAFSLNVSSLILELLLAGRFVFLCTRTCESLILIAENIRPCELRAPEQRPWLYEDDESRCAVELDSGCGHCEVRLVFDLIIRTKQGSLPTRNWTDHHVGTGLLIYGFTVLYLAFQISQCATN